MIRGRVLAVTDETKASYLTTAAVATDTTLYVEDAYPFEEGGGTLVLDDGESTAETVVYTAADPEADTITLATGLVNAYAVGTRVQVSPIVTQRVAIVQVEDTELGTIMARVPYSMQPAIAEGMREAGEGEEVTAEVQRGEWVVLDVPRTTPTIDGAYVELVADQVTAANIEAGSITADLLAAELVLSSTIKTAASGQRVEIDTAGIRLISSAGTTLVDLPTASGADATFRGDITADSLTVDTATFTGAAVFDTSSTNELKSAQADPATAPVLTQGVSAMDFDTGRSGTYFPRSPWYWADNGDVVYLEGSTGGVANKARVVDATTGTVVATALIDMPAAFYTHSIVYHEENDRWIGMAQKYATGDWYIVVWANDSGVPGAYQTRYAHSTYTYARPIIHKDNGSGTIYIGYTNSSGWVIVEERSWGTVGAEPTLVDTDWHTSPTLDFDRGLVSFWRGTADFGATRYVFRGVDSSGLLHDDYTVMTTLMAEQSTQHWTAEGNNWGVFYDGTYFREVSRDEEEAYTYANWTESGTSTNQYQVAYTWYDNAGTTHESALSPRAEIAHYSRRFVTVTWPGIPSGGADDPNSVRIYVIDNDSDQGATFANYYRQGTNYTDSSTVLSTYSTSTAGARDTVFSAGSPATISSQTGGMVLAGDGKLILPAFATGSQPSSTEAALYYDTTDDVVKVRNASAYAPLQGFIGAKALKGANQTITAANTDVITWSATSYDVGTFFDNANDQFTVPSGYAGYYRVTVVLEFAAYAANHGGRRVVQLRKNTTVIATASNTTHDRQTSDIIDTVVELAVGDDLDVRVNAVTVNTVVNGTGAETDTYFILTYLGPPAAN